MNCDQARALAADALGGELAGPDARDLHAHLATCAACCEFHDGLASGRIALESLVPTEQDADRAVASLTLGRAPGVHAKAQPPGSLRSLRAAPRARPSLRLAAMLALAFGLGYLARTQVPHATVPQAAQPSGRAPTPADAGLEDRYAAAARRFPGQSSLAWGLLSLARH